MLAGGKDSILIMFDDRADERFVLDKSFVYSGFQVPEQHTHHPWALAHLSLIPWAHLCRVQSTEAIVLQGSKEPFDAGHIPAPSNNEVPSSVIIMEIFPEAAEKHKGSEFESDFRETLSLTLTDLLYISTSPSFWDRCGVWKTWARMPALLFTSRVTLDLSLNFFETEFSH